MATTAPAPASYTPTSGDPPLLRMDSVQKVFLTDEVETHALSDVHLEIRRGEYVTIAGPSGCGKTTLLSILGLLDSPSGGRYELAGQDVTSLDAGQRARVRNRQIGFIFQAFNLIGDLTVFENVELPLTYRSGEHALNAAERRRRVHDALERVGMSHRQKHYPAQLSGGQQQRVAVARAVVGDPSILLADEPTGNLDSANGESVMELLRELHRGGATVCMVTHDPRYAQHAERTVHLFDGPRGRGDRNDGRCRRGPPRSEPAAGAARGRRGPPGRAPPRARAARPRRTRPRRSASPPAGSRRRCSRACRSPWSPPRRRAAPTPHRNPSMLADLRLAVRALRRAPGFALAAVSCLALGVGAVTAVLAVADAVLFRPLPAPGLARMVVVRQDARRSAWPTRSSARPRPTTCSRAATCSTPARPSRRAAATSPRPTASRCACARRARSARSSASWGRGPRPAGSTSPTRRARRARRTSRCSGTGSGANASAATRPWWGAPSA
jgi:putative ABC transport system ATP-binding protein